MKTIIVLFTVLILSAGVVAQTTMLVTNWAEPGPNMRVVNGIGYNTATSPLWKQFTQWEHCEGRGDVHVAERVNESAVLVRVSRPDFGVNNHNYAILLNYPKPSLDAIGLPIDCACMKTTNVSVSGVQTAAYDCGIQFTNKIATISRIKIPVVKTNK